MIAYNKFFCIIGLGNHAKTKLIAAIKSIKKHSIISITRNSKNQIKGITNYQNIDSALNKLKKNTNFIISTPPDTHYSIAKKILKTNAKVFIEKPAFISLVQIDKIIKLVQHQNSVLIELFPYKFTKVYRIFKKNFIQNINDIAEININFLIPKVPSKTFRDSKNITNSCLFDIGCYPISLLVDLGFKLENLKIKIFNPLNVKKESIRIFFVENNIKVNINIGIGKIYKNDIKLKKNNNESYLYDYFFYNIPKTKKIVHKSKNVILKKN